jgi:hypothetical protein
MMPDRWSRLDPRTQPGDTEYIEVPHTYVDQAPPDFRSFVKWLRRRLARRLKGERPSSPRHRDLQDGV